MNQQTLQNNLKQQFKANDVTTAKNTELYKLYDIKDNANPYEVVKTLNDYLYHTVKDGYSNRIYMPTLASYLFFLKNRKDLLDNLIVYKHAKEPYILIKKQIPQNYITLREWMARTMLQKGRELDKKTFKKLKQLIAAHKDLKNYLSSNFVFSSPFDEDEEEIEEEIIQNITIFGDHSNPNKNLKNLVIFKDLRDGIGALLYKVVKDNITVKEALMETNFVVLNNSENILNKLDDIVLYSSLTNARNIIASENISPKIIATLQQKIEDFYEGIGEKAPEMFKLSEFDFVKEAKRLIKAQEKDVKNKRDVGLSIA